MSFPFNYYAVALVSSLLTALVAVPVWRRWCIRTGLVDDPGHRKIHDQPIPLAGGLAVMTALFLPILTAGVVMWVSGTHASPGATTASLRSASMLDPYSVFLLQHGFGRRALELVGIFAAALIILAVGYWDDKHELKPGPKFAGQLIAGAIVAGSGARITLFVPSALFSFAITILWIVTVINAFNFMDNMNGLCAGLGAIAAWYFAELAAAADQYLVALIAFLTTGALLGFLPYNFPRARAFLGDSGSHLVGFILAVVAILPHFHTVRHPSRLAVLSPLLVLAVPLLDLVWVVAIRTRAGRPFYVGDTNHLSHRLVRLGLNQTSAVCLIWLVAAAVGALTCLL